MTEAPDDRLVTLDPEEGLWNRFFSVFPLVLIGSKEKDGHFDLAPKHMAMPMSWQNHFGFVCSPRHGTYQNIKREKVFTVSYPRPNQVVLTSLMASPRCDNDSKPLLEALPTFAATEIDGIFLKDGYLYFECTLDRIIDDLADNCLIIGKVITAHIDRDDVRLSDSDDEHLIHDNPILAYLYPGRFTEITQSRTFPFPKGFKR